MNLKVDAGGGDRQFQISSYRHKIKKLSDSGADKNAVRLVYQSNKKTIESQISEMGVAANEATCRIIRTVYHIAKKNRPISE